MPRSTPSNPSTSSQIPAEEASRLQGRLSALVKESESLLSLATSYSLEDSHIRLSRVRALVDRAEGIRSSVSRITRQLIRIHGDSEFENRVALAREAAKGSSRASGFERESAYLLRSLSSARASSVATSLISEARSAERRVSEVYRSLSDHRLEALTLLRAGLRIATEEYDFVASDLQSPTDVVSS